MKTIKALRRFYHNDNGKMVVVEVGKVLVVSEIEAISLKASNKAEIIPDLPPKIEAKKEEAKKEEPRAETPKAKDAPVETKKGGTNK